MALFAVSVRHIQSPGEGKRPNSWPSRADPNGVRSTRSVDFCAPPVPWRPVFGRLLRGSADEELT